MKINRTCYTK